MLGSLKYSIVKMLAKFVPKAVYLELKQIDEQKDKFTNKYYSQEGEDIVLIRHFNYKNKGFFVDVGAHHPIRLSNTYKLYLMGWQGINIDAMPGSMDAFNKIRTRDINCEAAISNKSETLEYFKFEEGALNTFDAEKAKHINENTSYKSNGKIEIRTKTLKEILDEKLPLNTKIDFFSIDAEGLDLQVLKSNDWQKYKPEVIIVETDKILIKDMLENETSLFLKQQGYIPFAKTYKSVFYKSE